MVISVNGVNENLDEKKIYRYYRVHNEVRIINFGSNVEDKIICASNAEAENICKAIFQKLMYDH